MRIIRLSSLISGTMLTGLFGAILSAAPIFGTFNIAGTLTATQSTLTWQLNNPPFPADFARIGPGSTGSFAGLDGTTITINDLTRTTEPVDSTFPQQPFIGFSGAPSLPTLDINFIYAGIYSTAACAALPAVVTQVCTPGPPNSPFNFVNNPPPAPTGPAATASFVFTGLTADRQSTWRANFTSQFNVPYQTVLAAFGPGGSGSVTNTYSATVTVEAAAVPEPSPIVLTACGLGLVLLSGIRHWRPSRRHS